MQKRVFANVFAFSTHWVPVPCYYFFQFNNYHKYTPNSAYYFKCEETREFYKIKMGRENLYKIKGAREQKSLGSPGLGYCVVTSGLPISFIIVENLKLCWKKKNL